MPKQRRLAGTLGKKPPAPSVKVRPGDFRQLVEILNGRKLRQADDAIQSGLRSAASRKRTGSRSPNLAAAIIRPAMTSRATSG